MRRTGAVAVLVLALAGAATAGVSGHLDPSPQVQLHGSSFVHGGIHISPVQDPYQGAWHGIVSWQVGCGGAERWSWEVEFGDVAAGSYRVPPGIRPHERSQSVFFYDASGFSKLAGRSRPVRIPAGAFVFPYVNGRCYGDGHWSERVQTDGAVLQVPPYIWYPTISTVGGRRLQSREAGPVVLTRGAS